MNVKRIRRHAQNIRIPTVSTLDLNMNADVSMAMRQMVREKIYFVRQMN